MARRPKKPPLEATISHSPHTYLIPFERPFCAAGPQFRLELASTTHRWWLKCSFSRLSFSTEMLDISAPITITPTSAPDCTLSKRTTSANFSRQALFLVILYLRYRNLPPLLLFCSGNNTSPLWPVSSESKNKELASLQQFQRNNWRTYRSNLSDSDQTQPIISLGRYYFFLDGEFSLLKKQ